MSAPVLSWLLLVGEARERERRPRLRVAPPARETPGTTAALPRRPEAGPPQTVASPQ